MRGIKDEKTIPTVLDREDVHLILSNIKKPQYQTLFNLLYVCGFRASEALNLRPMDIDAKRMMITISKSKGKRTRQVPVPENMLAMLRDYWVTHRNPHLIFPSRGDKTFVESSSTKKPISIQTAQEALKRVVTSLNLKKHVTPHTLRHCYATHLLDDGVNIRLVQLFLGHSSIQTTCGYLHVTKHGLENALEVIENLLGNRSKKGGAADEQATANL